MSYRSLLLGPVLLGAAMLSCGRTPILGSTAGSGAGAGSPADGGAGAIAVGGAGAIAVGGAGGGVEGGGGADGGAGGAGGTGGTPVCSALVSAGPPIGVADMGPQFAAEADPVLRPAPDDEVTVVFSFDGMANANPMIRHATFDPWSAWPPPPPSSDTVMSVGAYSFAADPLSVNAYGILHGENPWPPGMDFSIATPGQPGSGVLTSASALAERALFAVASPIGQHLVGMQRPGDFVLFPSFQLEIGFVHVPPNGVTYVGPVDAGCGDAPIAADAVAVTDGWLLAKNAFTSSCADDVGPSPSTDVVVRRFTGAGMQFFAAELLGAEVVETIDLEPRGDGAWLTYRRAFPSPVEVAKLDELGLLLDGPAAVSSPASLPLGNVAATALGDRLVAAFVDDPAGNPPDVTLLLVDDSLSTIASTSFEPSSLVWPSRLSVLASPAESSVLVAWVAGLDGGTRLRMQRFDCVELAPQ